MAAQLDGSKSLPACTFASKPATMHSLYIQVCSLYLEFHSALRQCVWTQPPSVLVEDFLLASSLTQSLCAAVSE